MKEMPRISLPPFLRKLQEATSTVDPSVAHWSEDGKQFIVERSEAFEKYLGTFYKGSLLTFIRQLHFYGFRKVDLKGEKWSFSHKSFRQDMPHMIYEIRRKTRTETSDGVASELEVQAIRNHVYTLSEEMKALRSELKEARQEIALLRQTVKRDFTNFDTNNYTSEDAMNKQLKKQKVLDSDTSFRELNSNPYQGLDPYDDSFENLACFLPITDSAFESMASCGQ